MTVKHTSGFSYFLAFLAALLFSLSAPLAKLLLGEIDPIMLAAYLYLGSGLGLAFIKLLQARQSVTTEAHLTKQELPWLVGSLLAGGVAAPIILMFSLLHTPAATASLLLNFEAVATTIIAALFFKEAIGRRIWVAILLITIASIILTLQGEGDWGLSPGALGIILACILWGSDNNFTRNLAANDPLSIVLIKGLGAGSTSLLLGFLFHKPFPGVAAILKVMILGFFSYGLSIVLFIYAMRNLGAARTSAVFGTAPFLGAVISLLIFREQLSKSILLSLPFMVCGAYFLLKEEHGHLHRHEPFEHEHLHSHDDAHHNHYHENLGNLTHSHLHQHDLLEHSHPHTPDIHHRHSH